MAPASSSSSLSAAAPPFVPQAPPLPQPVFLSNVPPPAVDLLPPPMGLPCPFMGAPPPLGFASQFQRLPPPPEFPCPVQGPPPPPRFPGPFLGPPPSPGFPVSAALPWEFPQGPGVGLPPLMPHDMIARPPAQHATQPQRPRLTAVLEDGDKPAARSGLSRRAASGRCRPKPLASRQQRAAPKRADGIVAVSIGDGGAMGDEPSPRSVLVGASTSPPGSPRSLPAQFPYPAPAPSSPPASAGDDALASKPRRRAGRPTGGQPLPPANLASGRGARRGYQQARRWFDPASSLTTLMIRNIPNGFTRRKVMNIIDQHCAEENANIAVSGGVKSEYDFLYVPFDFKTQANKGYCFVNVTSPDAAFRLWTHLHGYRWKVNDSRKTCEVDYATIQGREVLVKHFSGSFFECDTEEFLPVWFSPPRDGSRPAVVERHVVGRLGRRV